MERNNRFYILPSTLAIAALFLLIAAGILPRLLTIQDRTPPTIDVWYGSHQTFGAAGHAQRWVNVLGNASDPESKIASLQYSLNGRSPVSMRLGPDTRRLEKPGDFNLELGWDELHPGENILQIEATNGSGLKTAATVTLEIGQNVPSLPFSIDWSKVTDFQDVLQVVDGKWKWDQNGIRPVETGYDRMLAIGDASWIDFEVTVPVTVYGIDRAAFDNRSGGEHAGISVDLRWLGHSDIPEKCPPPHCGWDPVGDFNKYWFKQDGADYLGLKVKEDEKDFPTIPYHVEPGHTYVFRASVQTTPQGNKYRMKVWEPAVESEPTDWMFQSVAPAGDAPGENPTHGAFSLVAHYSDVSFGNVLVTPLP